MKGGGGTRLLNALHRAMALPTKDDVARTFVIVTDGYISVEPDVFEYIRANLGKANLFSFGIGSSVNRHLIEGMSRVGMGESFVSLNGTEAATNAKKFKNYIENPALTNIKVAFDGFDAYDVEPKAVPDLFAQRPVVVFGKYKGEAKGKIAITGTTGKGSFKQIVRVSDYTPDKNNDALKYLWARHKIAGLADLNRLRRDDARIEKVTNLGLEYSLMTAYTSFVAVDHRVRNDGGKSTTVKQVLPLPQGVSDLAVGNSKTQYLQFSGYGMAGGASMKKRIYRPRPTSPTSLRDAKEEDQESKITPERSPRVRPMVVSAKGSLSIADIVRTLRSKLTQCVRSLVAGTRGVVWFKAVIDARGKITVLRRVKSSLSSSRATKCLESQLRKMTFKTGSGNTSIHFGVRIH
jgi:Ca-activated chloride channel family protein